MDMLRIRRFDENDKQTVSEMDVLNSNLEVVFHCKSLELPFIDANNDGLTDNNVSRIKAGVYKCVKRHSPTYDDHFHILSTENRSMILIHFGNYYTNTEGCILPGRKLIDINGDGYLDVTSSRDTMKELNKYLPSEFYVFIMDDFQNINDEARQ